MGWGEEDWSRRQESNLDLSLRRAEFYPLKYSEIFDAALPRQTEIIADQQGPGPGTGFASSLAVPLLPKPSPER